MSSGLEGAKVILSPKSGKSSFTASNSRPISLLPALSKLLEKKLFDQIQCYFSVNKLTTDFKHAYREGHSTCTALTQMTDDWLKELDNKKIVGAVVLDFSAAFDIIDHNLLLKKRMCFGFSASAISWIQNFLSNRSLRVFFNGSFSNVVYRRAAL